MTTDVHPDWKIAYQQGQPVTKIARDSGVSPQAVYHHLKKQEVPKNPRVHVPKAATLPKRVLQKCVRLYQSGKLISEISRDTGLTRTVVKQALKLQNVELRPKFGGSRPHTIGEEAYNLRLQGHPWNKIQQILKRKRNISAQHHCRNAKSFAERYGLKWPLPRNRARSIPQDVIQECLKKHQEGYSTSQIQEILGLNRYYTAKILQGRLQPKRRINKRDSTRRALIYNMRKKGMKWWEIADAVSTPENPRSRQNCMADAHSHALRYSLPWPLLRNRRKKFPSRTRAKYVKLYQSGRSITWITARNPISVPLLRNLLIEEGVQIRTPKQVNALTRGDKSTTGKIACAMRLKGMTWKQIQHRINEKTGTYRQWETVAISARTYAKHMGIDLVK